MAPGTTVKLKREIELGMRGLDVKACKRAAARAGFPKGKLVGITDTCTDADVANIKLFQQAKGLDVDGVIGQHTLDALVPTMDAVAKSWYGSFVLPKAPAAVELCYPHPVGAVSSVCQSLHPTAGLDGNWGIDFCAPGGTPVVAVEKAVVVKLSGHAPTEVIDPGLGIFGWNIHYATAAGYRYFSTHYGTKKCAVGQQLVPGTLLGEVGQWPGDPGRSHTHLGVTSPKSVDDAKARILSVSKAPRLPLT